jgi:catechol 2,3-dioxygenase-like lactoylglutathione lyase family enzyme
MLAPDERDQMSDPKLTVTEIDHINQLISDTDLALDFYRRVYGVEIDRIFEQFFGPYDNFVFSFGSALIEIFCPVPPEKVKGNPSTPKGDMAGEQFRQIHRRFGNIWQAVLWRVPSLEGAIEVFEKRGLRLVNVELDPDRRWAFTDPRDTFGMVMQLEDRDEWDKTVHPNPMGVTGLAGLTVAVNDADEAADFFTDLCADAPELYREDRPKLNAKAIGISMAGYTVEFLSPTGEGEMSRFLDKYRQRIRTATFKVNSFDALEKHLAGVGVQLKEGDRPGVTKMIAPEDNLDCQVQFTE